MASIEDIRKKVDRLINEKGLNYRNVSLKIGRKDSYLQQYVKYGYPRRLKEIDRTRLAKILEIDDTEIMDDEVIASKTIAKQNANSDANSNKCLSDNLIVSVDVLNSKIDNNNFYDNVIGYHVLNYNIANEPDFKNIKNIKIVKVSDDMMSPTINNGDYVWFDTSYKAPESDGLYLFAIGRDLSVKRVQTSPIDGTIAISCNSEEYKPYIAKRKSDIKVLGKVVFVLHKV